MYTLKLFVCIYIVTVLEVQNGSASTVQIKGDMELVMDEESQQCNSKLNSCDLDIEIPGPKGVQGPPGIKGIKGQAIFGLRGPPGLPGLPGVCACQSRELGTDSDRDGEVDVGTRESPSAELCDSLELDEDEPDMFYYLGSLGITSFAVICDLTTKATCVPAKTLARTNYLYVTTQPFWISEKSADLKTIYGLTNAQILWLQQRSSSVSQTLRYHCKNSIPYNKDDVNKSISLLSWNDVVIGPTSNDVPIVYTVPTETDGCSKQKPYSSKEASTDIIITSKVSKRLPVVDIRIKDTRGQIQQYSIEHVKLCFEGPKKDDYLR